MDMSQRDAPAALLEHEPYFNASLHPYRSLGSKGFFWLMTLVSVVMLLVSLPFFLLGAWPIVGFAGLDILLVYWAFRRSYRDARAREQVLVTGGMVEITHHSAKGERQSVSYNPYWVRLETRHEEDKGMTELAITSHGRRTVIGSFLHACERESLAAALEDALLKARTCSLSGNAQVSGG